MPTIVATYERVSTLKQANSGFGLGAQRQSLDAFIAARPGWVHPKHLTFRDTGSGADFDLPGLTAMLDAAREEAFDTLVVPDIDRLARNMAKALIIEHELTELGVRVVYQTMPDADASDEAEFSRNIFRSLAQFERSKIARRTASGRNQKARMGKVVGQGAPPYGYRFTYEQVGQRSRVAGLEPDPATAAIAQEILLALKTRSTIAVAEELNDRGIPGPTGLPWNTTTVRRIGQSTTYAGTWEFRKRSRRDERIEVPVPALISVADHEGIVRALDRRRSTRRGRMADDPYTLRGALWCQGCGRPLWTDLNNGYRYYLCGSKCGLPAVPASTIEAELQNVLLATLLDKDAIEAFAASHAEREATQAEQWQARVAKIDRDLERERRRLAATVEQLVDAGTGELGRQLRAKAEELEASIERLTALRREAPLVVTPMDEIEAITDYALNLRMAMQQPQPVRNLAQMTGLRGTVAPGGPEDRKLGRLNRFRVGWTADIPVTIPSGTRSWNRVAE